MKTRLISLAEELSQNRADIAALQNIANNVLDPLETVEVTFRLYTSTDNRAKLSTDEMSTKMRAELHLFVKKMEIFLREEDANIVRIMKEEME